MTEEDIEKQLKQIVEKVQKDLVSITPDPMFEGLVYLLVLNKVTDSIIEHLPTQEETITPEDIEKIRRAITTKKEREEEE